MHVCLVGGGAALAQPVIEHFLAKGDRVTAVCRKTKPTIEHPSLTVVQSMYDVAAPINLLITMTGSVRNAKIVDMGLSDWRSVMDANLASVFEALRQGLPKMADSGNIVVVGSIVGSTGAYGAANYAAAKAGLVGLVRSAALEYAKGSICVNLLELGYVDAGMGERLGADLKAKILPTIPLKRFARPEEVVYAVEFLATTKYMTGGVLTLAGGMR